MRKFWNKLMMLTVICISSYATAQNANEKKGLQASAIIGMSNFNFGSINDVLENQGLPQIKDGLQFTPSFNITLFSGNRDYWEVARSEEHTSELQSRENLVCCLLLEKKK